MVPQPTIVRSVPGVSRDEFLRRIDQVDLADLDFLPRRPFELQQRHVIVGEIGNVLGMPVDRFDRDPVAVLEVGRADIDIDALRIDDLAFGSHAVARRQHPGVGNQRAAAKVIAEFLALLGLGQNQRDLERKRARRRVLAAIDFFVDRTGRARPLLGEIERRLRPLHPFGAGRCREGGRKRERARGERQTRYFRVHEFSSPRLGD